MSLTPEEDYLDSYSEHPPRSPGASERPRSVSATISSNVVSTDNVKVVCRVRPFNQREIDIQNDTNAKMSEWEQRPLRAVVEMNNGATKFLDCHNDFNEKETFKFDVNLWSIPNEQQESDYEFANQEMVYEKVGKITIDHAFAGYNTCMFAYGQTGSGKTYTMMGTDDERGLIPRSCVELFRMIQEKQNEPQHHDIGSITWRVDACFFEIYNEKVKDLLWQLADPEVLAQYDRENLKVRHTPGQGPYVVGLTMMAVQSWEECNDIINAGMQNRACAATKMNDTSSRSHAIFRLTLTQTTTLRPTKQFERPKQLDRIATINLVDLAGSERLKKSGAQGQRLKEAAAINLSLTTLKNVIDALVEGRPLIPYRDSQLTWLLSESLGGNSKTFMIACISPHMDNAEETLNTLRYALRTQGIINHARINESDEARRIAELQRLRADAQRKLEEGVDSDKKKDLKNQIEETQATLSKLQQESFQDIGEEKKLKAQIEVARETFFRSIYCKSFHMCVLSRIARQIAHRKEKLTDRMKEMYEDKAKAHEELASIESQLKLVQKEELERKNLYKRMEREHAKSMAHNYQTAEAIKNMQGVLENLDEKLRQANTRINITRIAGHGLIVSGRKRIQKTLEELAAQHATDLQETSRQSQDERQNMQLLHQKNCKKLEADITNTNEEIKVLTQKIQITNDDRKSRLRKLNEDSTFYEHENRNLNDERVLKLTEIERQQSQRYENESSRLSEKSVRSRQAEEQKHIAFMHEVDRQLKMADTLQEELIAQTNEKWNRHIRAVEEESSRALNEQSVYYTKALSDHECQIEDARNFLSEWQQKSKRYGAVQAEIMAAAVLNKGAKELLLKELANLLLADHKQRTTVAPPTPASAEPIRVTPNRSASRGNGGGTSSPMRFSAVGGMAARLGSRRPDQQRI